jgi:hypothetical protein
MAHATDRNSAAFIVVGRDGIRVGAEAELTALDQADIASGVPWHYATIKYGNHLMGLLVGTDDEDIARREAQEMCESFGSRAILLGVKKVVLQ